MTDLKKTLSYALYFVLPLVFFAVIHLTFAYGEYSLDMSTWEGISRAMSAYFGLVAFCVGVFIAHKIVSKNN